MICPKMASIQCSFADGGWFLDFLHGGGLIVHLSGVLWRKASGMSCGGVCVAAIFCVIAELQIQILPLIENLEWPYIWGVVCSYAIVRRSVGRSVGRSGDLRIGGWGILGVW